MSLAISQNSLQIPILQIRRNFQITLPAKLRQALHLNEGDLIEANLINDGQAIILKPKTVVSKGRVFSEQEINNWLEEDKIDQTTFKKAKQIINSKQK